MVLWVRRLEAIEGQNVHYSATQGKAIEVVV